MKQYCYDGVATRQKNILAKLRVHLLQGKTITDAQARDLWNTNRLSEYIRRCRKKLQMNIETEMITSKNGDVYGRYSLVIPKKESRITNQRYR